ncbi:MAG: SUMF1/EgtB/PvdO family nonheme iron enzyme [Candidatus Nitronauta litoralis]|uniref:SUMF1/EgtB/PvdO family nonheme iron enzyme n=1 Tax=Candidatus Nitronauta litoralis TaxID=2705533 RepID=A0A7T0BTB4_9BACT|nr:MAG: SUMF1/EgtB/PvdO family nonheme iron enzyme [Candidatus Nitronauta litoralis]
MTQALWSISKDWDGTVDKNRFHQSLQQLTSAVEARLGNSPSPQKTIQTLREVIHKDYGYQFTDQVDPQGIPVNPAELFLHGLLKSKRGYCMNLSLLYLIVGDRLDLPLHGVALPNHFFVRYDDGTFRANIEATQGGQSFDDSFYRDRFLGASANNPFFMKNLTKKQTLGAYLNNVGMVMYRNKRTPDALFYLEQSIALNPKALDVRNNLANIYSEQKDFNRSIELYHKALETDPNNWQTYFNLGIALSEAKRDKEAIEAFRQVAQINPGHAPSHNVLARLYMEKGKWSSALIHLKTLIQLEPQNPGHRLRVAHAYLQMDQARVALNFLQETQRVFPLTLDVNELIAEAHYRLKEYKSAGTQLEHIIEKSPGTQHAYIQLGWIHYLQNNIEDAIQRTQKGLEAGKDPSMKSLGEMNLGLFHLVKGDAEEAERWYQKALSQKNDALLSAMAEDLSEAQNRFPENAETSFFIGWVLMESGKPGEAIPHLKRFLERKPTGRLANRAHSFLKEAEKAGPSRNAKAPEGMILIPEGFFIMGSNHHGEDERPEHKVFVDAFFMDETEATNKDFAAFLNTVSDPKDRKKFFKAQKFSTIISDGSRYWPVAGAEEYPANSVTWFGAKAYCEWKEKRIPTEAEWEKAARGPDGLIFPWGNEPPTHDRARYFQTWTQEQGFRTLMPVKSMPEGKSPYGLYHMLGNVKEWVDDWFDREYYKQESHKVNPVSPLGGEFKVLKGGSWRDLKSVLYSSFRNNSFPGSGLDDYGVRCAKSADGKLAPGRLAMLEPLQ